MEPHTFITSLGGISHLEGLALVLGIFALLWYSSFRSMRKAQRESINKLQAAYQGILDQYRNDLKNTGEQHLQAARDMRQMYDNNAKLVEQTVALSERYEKRADYLIKIIETNIQSWQLALKSIEDNQFCPVIREQGGKS